MKLEKAIKHIKSFQAILDIWRREMFEECLTLEEETIKLNVRVYDQTIWKSLPRYAQSELLGYINAIRSAHEKNFIWTHCIDGKRFMIRDVYLENRYEEINKQNPSRSAFCYVVKIDGRTVYFPYRDADRKLDIDEGILKQEDIDTIRFPNTHGKNRRIIRVLMLIGGSHYQFEVVDLNQSHKYYEIQESLTTLNKLIDGLNEPTETA